MCNPLNCMTILLGSIIIGAAGGIGYGYLKSGKGRRIFGRRGKSPELSPSAAGYARCAFGRCKG